MRPTLQRWHRNSVVVLTALIVVLAMHGLTSDHGMGMPGMAGMGITAQPTMTATRTNPVGETTAAAAAVSADTHSGHPGGMCVGILGIALLLWLIGRSRRRQLRTLFFAFRSAVRARQARAGPLPPLSRPSLVKLGISRT